MTGIIECKSCNLGYYLGYTALAIQRDKNWLGQTVFTIQIPTGIWSVSAHYSDSDFVRHYPDSYNKSETEQTIPIPDLVSQYSVFTIQIQALTLLALFRSGRSSC